MLVLKNMKINIEMQSYLPLIYSFSLYSSKYKIVEKIYEKEKMNA